MALKRGKRVEPQPKMDELEGVGIATSGLSHNFLYIAFISQKGEYIDTTYFTLAQKKKKTYFTQQEMF